MYSLYIMAVAVPVRRHLNVSGGSGLHFEVYILANVFFIPRLEFNLKGGECEILMLNLFIFHAFLREPHSHIITIHCTVDPLSK
jgi:hypothetical protein